MDARAYSPPPTSLKRLAWVFPLLLAIRDQNGSPSARAVIKRDRDESEGDEEDAREFLAETFRARILGQTHHEGER